MDMGISRKIRLCLEINLKCFLEQEMRNGIECIEEGINWDMMLLLAVQNWMMS